MTTRIVSLTEAKEILNNTNNIFSVLFVKRSNGQERLMSCRNNVRKGLKGGSLPYDASSKGLKGTYDMHNKGYRMIALEGIISINANKVQYVVR